jgi:hypothetical protein
VPDVPLLKETAIERADLQRWTNIGKKTQEGFAVGDEVRCPAVRERCPLQASVVQKPQPGPPISGKYCLS